MAFSVTLVAPNKAGALAQIAAATGVPQPVKDFASAAVSAIADDPVLQITLAGHLHASPSDTEVSTATLSVTPLRSA